ncbi:MAG: YafY family transcriptional regulator [Dehalococcoidia bacterium]|nr:YafY family transcriptional regulator [Dehalococcoidia bacterium]
MRRADRLFQVIQLLRRRHVLTAATIAEQLEVSERTVYRDIADLVRSGVPIAGEAGVGYTLRRGFDLPPLMFTEEEIEALVLGTRVVSSWADEALARAAESALARIEAALPDRLKARLIDSRLFAPGFHVPQGVAAALPDLRHAIDERRLTRLDYVDMKGARTDRIVRPLGLFFWGNKWSLTAWCELREDFRDFRLDRIAGMEALETRFEAEPGKTIEDFFASRGHEE